MEARGGSNEATLSIYPLGSLFESCEEGEPWQAYTACISHDPSAEYALMFESTSLLYFYFLFSDEQVLEVISKAIPMLKLSYSEIWHFSNLFTVQTICFSSFSNYLSTKWLLWWRKSVGSRQAPRILFESKKETHESSREDCECLFSKCFSNIGVISL